MNSLLRIAVLLMALMGLAGRGEAQARPYSLPQIVALLEGEWAGTDILGLVGEACISFRINDSSEAALRRVGGDATLISGLRNVCFRRPPDNRPPPPPPARGIVEIEGELPPGWSRTVNDLPLSTNRRIDLTPGRAARIMVSAPGWCPAQMEMTLKPGEEVRWTPTMRARPWVGGCS